MSSPYQTLTLPVDSIQSHPENDFTMDESEMQELVASIRSEGLGQLPLVRKLPDGAYQMIAGHRRLEAYKRLAREDAAFRAISVTMRAMMSFVRTPLSDGSASRSAGTSLPMAA